MLDQLLSSAVTDEEALIKARALNLLLLITAVIVVVYAALLAVFAPGQLVGNSIVALGAALLLSLGCYWLSRRGRVQSAGYVFFAGLFVAISLNLVDPSSQVAALTIGPFLYTLVILPSGYILHPRISFLAATLAAIYTTGYLLIAPPASYLALENKAEFWANMGLAFALYYILSSVAWIFGNGLSQALHQTRHQNRELRQVAQELEAQRQLQADTARQILELAERLAHYSSRQTSGSNRQAAAIAQVSASVGELNQAAQEIAEGACLVDEAAQQTLRSAKEGQDIIWMNSEAMGLIHSTAYRGVQEATSLDNHLKQVSKVATAISKIASQIQLVAFNATLEAAEAGEAGQRFGVVAAEVKDLAADSLKQAKDAAQIVHQVQEAGEAVVTLSDEQMQAIRSGADAMNRSSAANQAITNAATQMAELAGQIQKTTAQQQQASEQVATSIEEIRAVVDRWVISSYQIDETVSGLRALAEQLT